MAKSEMIDTSFGTEAHRAQRSRQGQFMRDNNDFEILQRFNGEKHYDRSNLPPVILPSVPTKMRAESENSRIIMETIII